MESYLPGCSLYSEGRTPINHYAIPVMFWFPVKNTADSDLFYAAVWVSDDVRQHFRVQMKATHVLNKMDTMIIEILFFSKK